MNRIIASAALTAALVASALPALAKTFVQDNAQLFSAGTVSQLNTRISNFNHDTGKEIVVVTVPSAPNGDVRTAAENTFAQQTVNGVLIYIDKGDRRDYVIPDRAAVQAGWWNSQTSNSLIAAMGQQFRAGNFDAGITGAVNSVFDVYRSHLNSRGTQPARTNYAQQTQSGGVHIGMFWWIIIALFAFFIIRSLLRARSGAYYGGGYGGPGSGPGGPGGPGPGYGPGYGGYGYGGGGFGGGGFWSGLLGGLGGAWLGNELFGQHNYGGMQSGFDPNTQQMPTDSGGWQSDPGQADMSGGGGWGGGDMGGGFGGGDMGGGDMGGGFGGGDAGGGW